MKTFLNENRIPCREISIDPTGKINDELVLKDLSISYVLDPKTQTPTEQIECVRYYLADPITFANFTIKVPKLPPIITKDALEAAENAVFVDVPIEQLEIHPYEINYGTAKVTITAPFLKLQPLK